MVRQPMWLGVRGELRSSAAEAEAEVVVVVVVAAAVSAVVVAAMVVVRFRQSSCRVPRATAGAGQLLVFQPTPPMNPKRLCRGDEASRSTGVWRSLPGSLGGPLYPASAVQFEAPRLTPTLKAGLLEVGVAWRGAMLPVHMALMEGVVAARVATWSPTGTTTSRSVFPVMRRRAELGLHFARGRTEGQLQLRQLQQ